jgi:hypothetical protein
VVAIIVRAGQKVLMVLFHMEMSDSLMSRQRLNSFKDKSLDVSKALYLIKL